ncbi:hypothetical protein Sjap_015491 [Stephania japonica]|uniref:Uncharacterized protein n=1 Tax=Stephania japonica TaxID=461633 RepID=A0AAP0NSJ8_9MAGN
MDGRSTIPSETRQAGIVIRSPQATDQGAVISKMVASLTASHRSDNDFTRGYMMEMIDEGFAVPRGGRTSSERALQKRSTLKLETRRPVVTDETGINKVDRIGIQGDERER